MNTKSVNIDTERTPLTADANTESQLSPWRHIRASITAILMHFSSFVVVFIGLCTILSPMVADSLPMLGSSADAHGNGQAAGASNGTDSSQSCTPRQVAMLVGGSAAVGTLFVVAGFGAVGLTAAGPIVGGAFAGAQGAGVVAGSSMAVAQSAAMTGAAYATGAAVGSVVAMAAAAKACIA